MKQNDQKVLMIKTYAMQKVAILWQQRSWWSYILFPFSCLFQLFSHLRYYWYVWGKNQRHFSVPVIVVGNISLGGTGKTPFVAWIAHFFLAQGLKPGIVSRGYGGLLAADQIIEVKPDSLAKEVGDEPLLLARKCNCPVFIGRKRPQVVEQLLHAYPQTDVIISDDGLQHYALGRNIEIAIVDGDKRVGNGFCLPAGPLRESPQRLAKVDFVVVNGLAKKGEWSMQTTLNPMLYAVNDAKKYCSLQDFLGKTVYAVAGIGTPERFFNMLKENNINIIAQAFPDHHVFGQEDFNAFQDFPILMTEKDAVKCSQIVLNNAWYVLLDVMLPSEFELKLLERVKNG